MPDTDEKLFTTVQIGRYPAWQSLLCSVVLHAGLVTGLGFVTFGGSAETAMVARDPNHPTELRIGDRFYYVSEIPRPEPPGPGRIGLTPKRSRTLPSANLARQRTATTARLALPAPVQKAALPRKFIPPDVKRRPEADQTLIQFLSPPNLEAARDVRLPTLRVWTAWPNLKPPLKKFVAPGQPKRIVEDTRPAPLPVIEFAHAVPVDPKFQAKLRLPPAPEMSYDAPAPKTAAGAAPEGDAINVLSLQQRPVPLSNTLLIPPGNVEGKTGENTDPAALGEGSGTARVPLKGTGRDAGGEPAAQPAGDGSAGAGIYGGTGGTGTHGNGSGGESAVPGSGNGNGPVAATSADLNSSLANMVRVEPSPTGSFDSMVVQSSPADMFAESRDLLTGRPIYTVYLAAGTPRDWTLWFCIPGSGQQDPPAMGNVVLLGDGPKVRAPYPTLLVRPRATFGAGEKYLLVYGRISRDGRFEGLRLVRHGDPKTDEILLAGLGLWTFRPATRDGVAVLVEILLSIPADRY